jgi:hypothetical protein
LSGRTDISCHTPSAIGLGSVDNVPQLPMSYLDIDGTLVANSDSKVASQRATKTYADTKEPAISKATAFNRNFETSTSNIKMNGAVAVGASNNIPRSDHVHAVDTSREAAIGAKNSAFNQAFETNPSNIKADGAVSVGILTTIPRADHVHPGSIAVSPAPTVTYTPANPTGTVSTAAYVMMGLGTVVRINPNKGSAKIKLSIDGIIKTTGGTGYGVNLKIAYGSIMAPSNGAVATGTVVGAVLNPAIAITTQWAVPFSKTVLITGLSPGIQYWFDIQLQAVGGGTASILGLTAVLEELEQ